jgi:hypothetical protein
MTSSSSSPLVLRVLALSALLWGQWLLPSQTVALSNGLARTPAMGWNESALISHRGRRDSPPN